MSSIPARYSKPASKLHERRAGAPLLPALTIDNEKQPLPRIIVTPSSPSGETEFEIHFFAPETPIKSSFVSALLPSLSNRRFRTTALLAIPILLIATHFLMMKKTTMHGEEPWI